MSNSILHRDVFISLISLDSYNREYNRGVNIDRTTPHLGNASFLLDSVDVDNSFYARAYSYNGQVFISYRGTDQMAPGLTSPGDILTGWGLGGGAFGAPQGELALGFYHTVRDLAGESPITLTGHSLGGGLAGFVAAVYGESAIVFDSMPYIAAAQNLHQDLTTDDPFDPAMQALIDQWRQFVYGDETPFAPDFGGVSGFFVEGEVLDGLARDRALYGHQGLDAAASLGPVDLHSQSLLTLLLFGEKQVSPQRDDWEAVKQQLVAALFDHEVGAAAGAQRIEGASEARGDFAEILRTTLAYSMIDGGVHHFGNSGVHALFDDANDLGRALSLPGANRNLQLSAQALVQSFTQYAGQLAIGKVMAAAGGEERAGVLTIAPDETTLSVDYAQERWRAGMDGANPDVVLGREEILTNAIGGGLAFPASLQRQIETDSAMVWLWNSSDATKIARVTYALTNDDLATTLIASDSGVSLFIAGDGENDIVRSGGDDFIVGGEKDDVLSGGAGDDLIHGGGGDDRLSGGGGRNMLIGGAGDNTVFFDPEEGGLTIRVSMAVNVATWPEPVIQLDRGEAGLDRIFEIQNVALSDGVDRLVFEDVIIAQNVSGRNIVTFDGGDAAAGADVLDFGAFAGPVELRSGAGGVSLFQDGAKTGLTFTNFEHVIGSAHDDVLDMRALAPGGALTAAQREQIAAARAMPITASLNDPAAYAQQAAARVAAAAVVPQNQIEVVIEGGAGEDRIVGAETGYNRIFGGGEKRADAWPLAA